MKRRSPGRNAGLTLTMVGLLIGGLLPVTPVYGAEPNAGRLDRRHDEIAWTGGPFYASNPSLQDNRCGGIDRPTCDIFELSVRAQRGWLVSVAAESSEGNDLALHVYDRTGEFVAGQDRGGKETLAFRHDPSKQPYEVRVQPFLVQPGATYQGDARLDPPGIADVGGEDCLEPVPQVDVPSILADDGRAVRLDVLVLLDAMKLRHAGRIFDKAAVAYELLGIDLAATFKNVSFVGDDFVPLLEESVRWTGGERPNGVDIVYTLTSKDIGGGLAMCIGGVRYDGAAYAVSEGDYPEDLAVGPFRTYVDTQAVIVAHEIGHLMGAHHHYGNCLEGLAPEDAEGPEVTTCTVMNDLVIFNSLRFDSFSATVVRDHALRFADD